MFNVILGLIGLGIIVFIHELGHFIAARLCGVEVETFSIGMGPVLLRKKYGKTEYRLSLIPMGGYCGMKGEKGFQDAIENNLSAIPKDDGSFYGVHPLKRAAIAFSGPLFNFIFAIFAFIIIAIVGYSFSTTPNKIILVSDIDPTAQSIAKDAGLNTGDIITAIDGTQITNFSDIYSSIAVNAQKTLSVQVDRNGEKLDFKLTPSLETSTGAGKIGIYSWVDPVIDSVKNASPAHLAGLQKDDLIIAIDEKPIFHTIDLSLALQDKSNAKISLLRDNQQIDTEISLPYNEAGRSELGVFFKSIDEHSKTYSFFPAIAQGVKETFNLLSLTLKSLGLLFKGVDVTQAVSGPIRITLMIGEVAQSGFSKSFAAGVVNSLNFLALISISLFIMNLLPIPILDGGLIVFAVLEFIRKKQVPPKILYKIQFVGLGFIAILFSLALFSDARFILGSLFRK
ncbi:MAG: RIP metalloprotease RseP [Treponemataceae bacterium]